MADIAIGAARRAPWRVKNIGLWALQIAAAAMFLMAGELKLAGDPKMVGMFAVIGIGQWFRYLTGSLEVIGAFGLLIPRAAGFGALLLTVVMIGAVLTHFLIVGGNPALAIILLVTTAIVAWGRKEQIWKALR